VERPLFSDLLAAIAGVLLATHRTEYHVFQAVVLSIGVDIEKAGRKRMKPTLRSLIGAIAIALLSMPTMADQTPQLSRVMREKLAHSQAILGAVVTSDWPTLDRESRALARATQDPCVDGVDRAGKPAPERRVSERPTRGISRRSSIAPAQTAPPLSG
jgi:hypothetical protein